MKDYEAVFEPRSEKFGLFPEETSLKSAIKELNNPSLSIKRSTRGYTVLYLNKDINPMLAGKKRNEMENLLHEIHCRYIKYLAIHVFKKSKFRLDDIKNEDEFYIMRFSSDEPVQSIIIECDKKNWKIKLNIMKDLEETFKEVLQSFEARIGKKLSIN